MTKTKTTSYNFTAEDIVRERDELGQSWRQVAANLGLMNRAGTKPSPSAARTAYTALTGVAHDESQPKVKRTKRSSGAMGTVAAVGVEPVLRPNWDDDSDQDGIIEATRRKVLGVHRVIRCGSVEIPKTEDIEISEVHHFTYDQDDGNAGLTMHFHEVVARGEKGEPVLGGMRSIRVQDIKEVRS